MIEGLNFTEEFDVMYAHLDKLRPQSALHLRGEGLPRAALRGKDHEFVLRVGGDVGEVRPSSRWC